MLSTAEASYISYRMLNSPSYWVYMFKQIHTENWMPNLAVERRVQCQSCLAEYLHKLKSEMRITETTSTHK